MFDARKGDVFAEDGLNDRPKTCDIWQRGIFVGSDCSTSGVGLVTGCVGIGDKSDAIAKCRCTANGGIDAEFAGVATNNDMFDPEFIEDLFKLRAKKCIWRCFANEEIPRAGDDVFL